MAEVKIGLLTFHWAANHGAVLQAYSLVEYLRREYHAEVELIDYCPKNQELSLLNVMRHIRDRAVLRKIKELKKERSIRPFRQAMPLSARYYTNQELKSADLPYDILIAGSDQIWNPYFLMHGEGGITPVYYLNFGGKTVKKIAVSASFGCGRLPEECKKIALPLLKEFSALSVRERTGAEILRDMGIADGQLTADPTALLSRETCLALCAKRSVVRPGSLSKLILRKQSRENDRLIRTMCAAFSKVKANDIEYMSIPDWLAAIRDSGMVVTNSFHCVMMCLKLHTPFVVVLESGKSAGMNDRFVTLLSELGLEERIITDVAAIESVSADIDFVSVDQKMGQYSRTLKDFLERNIR